MTANELRIGNYFQWSPFASMGRGEDRITHGQQIMDYLNFKEGIPITEEWLLKFGFEKLSAYEEGHTNEDYVWQIETERSPTIRFISGSFYEDDYGVPLKHVHQLQNLYYALTNKKL